MAIKYKGDKDKNLFFIKGINPLDFETEFINKNPEIKIKRFTPTSPFLNGFINSKNPNLKEGNPKVLPKWKNVTVRMAIPFNKFIEFLLLFNSTIRDPS